MGPKKKAAKDVAGPVGEVAAGSGAGAAEFPPNAVAFTPAEAKKLAKLLKASDRGKRLDAIRVVSKNHGYIASGGCLLPLLESVVAKKKMEEVVQAASQVIADYLAGRDAEATSTQARDSALAALQEASKKPAKYKLVEVLTNLVLNPDQQNSWNAVRSLRSIAAAVDSLPRDSPQKASLGSMLLGPGQPVERLCCYLIVQETERNSSGEDTEEKQGASGGCDPIVPWQVVRLQIMDIIGVMCGVSKEAVQFVVSTGTVRCVLNVLRSITESEAPDMPLLTSTLVVLLAVAKAGEGGTAPASGATQSENAAPGVAASAAATAVTGVSDDNVGTMSPELAALAVGGAWGAVYDALKGPCMARAKELQQASVPAGSGKKGGVDAAAAAAAAAAVSADLVACLDNMARCAEVLRVMAMTGAGLEEEGALVAGVAAMSSILGMQGLPREQPAVANLMTGMVKAMGSMACLSESNRNKVCSAGAAAKVLALMAPSGPSPPDTPHGRLMRKTAEKCLHHLVVSRVTWLADDRALCDTSVPAAGISQSSEDAPCSSGGVGAVEGERDDHEKHKTAEKQRRTSRTSVLSNRDSRERPPPALGPAYLTVDAVLAAANADSIDVRCRAVRLLSRLMSSPRCAAALGVSPVPALGRLIEWWLRTKDDPEAHRTPRPTEPTPTEGGGGKSPAGGGGGKKGAGGKAPAKEAASAEPTAEDEATAAAAARIAAKRLEESDSTRVLRDEALAYALTTMLKLAETGMEERAAIGENAVVELLVKVLKRLPCTPEEFYANSCEELRSKASVAVAGTTSGAKSPTSIPPVAAAACKSHHANTDKLAARIVEKDGCEGHAPSHAIDSGFLNPKPDTTLDLSLAQRRPSSSINPRKLWCWRGGKSIDPEVPLFSPLDWGWDFEVGVSQEPVQPGLVLRAEALRVLLAVANGYDPVVEATAAVEASAKVPTTMSKGGAGAAAAAEASARAAAVRGGSGARTVLKHVLPVCLDLLSVDVRHGVAVENFDGFGSTRSYRQAAATGQVTPEPTSSMPQQQHQHVGADVRQPCNNNLTAAILLGSPVSPSEELVHEEIRLTCLRLLGSLLRLGATARAAFLSAAASHRGGGYTHLEEENATSCGKRDAAAPINLKKGCTGDKHHVGENSERGGSAWVRPESFRTWNLSGEGNIPSLQTSLPYVRALSMFMLPLRNPDASIIDIVAALVAVKRLCREDEHEVGGTQPEPHPQSAENDGIPMLPTSREGTAGVLVDTLAGVAVSMGILVPLVSILGCALATGGSAVELAPEINLMVSECQALIDYLIRRGHARESFWSSLPSLGQVAEAKAAAAEAAAPTKAPRKSKGSAGKAGKGGGKGSKEASAIALEIEEEGKNHVTIPKPPEPPAGRPDPNLGPDRASWAELLNARIDEQRTQTRGTTALLMATITGLETAVKILLLAGADPNVRGNDGRSPLMCALAQGMDEAARGLLEAGADVDAVSHQGYNVLKCAFLCPSRRVMHDITRKDPETASEMLMASAGSGRTGAISSARSSRRGSTTPIDGGSGNSRVGRRESTSRSMSRSRSRSRSGSLTRDHRRSSLSRSVSFGENALVRDTGGAAAAGSSSGGQRRLSRMTSLSALSARAALHDFGPRESARPLKTPCGTTVVRGDARMVPYILACGADPNVSSANGDFPLHWAVTGTELTVRILNQNVKIVAAVRDGGDVFSSSEGQCSASTEKAATNEGSSGSGNANRDSAAAATMTAAGDNQRSSDPQEDLALVKILVGAGADLDACNPEGMTALHAAVILGRGTLAGALLDAGASPNYADCLGCLPLHYACLRAVTGYADLASRLLALGMGRPLDKGVHRDLRKGKTQLEKLLLDVADIMHRGLREATEPSCITQHRATRSELLNFVSAEGFAPIHYVCDGRITGRNPAAAVLARWQERARTTAAPGTHLNGGSGRGGQVLPENNSIDRAKILRWLLSESEVDPTVRLPHGATTLHLASRKPGSQGADLVRSLIQTGGVNLDSLDSAADSLLGLMGKNGNANGRDDVRRNGQGTVPSLRFSALHYALQAGSWESADLLLSAGACVIQEGRFPPCLHVACLAGAPVSLVERLLAADKQVSSTTILPAGAGPYAATPLFLAAASGSADLVIFLLSFMRRNSTPQTLIDIGEDETTILVDTGIDDGCPRAAGTGGSESILTMRHSPSDGRNPLHAAAAGGHTMAALALLDADRDMEVEGVPSDGLASCSWLNASDAAGNTPLDVAVNEGYWECAERLAAAERFDVRLATERGPSSSLIAIERANMAIVDEGLGDPPTLRDLRESNKLIMTLLKRLRDAETSAAASGEAATDTTATAPFGKEKEELEAAMNVNDTAGISAQPEDDPQEPVAPAAAVASAAVLPLSRTPPVPIVHLHPCFAEGVLYSNAKGIFVPDTPEWKRRRRSSRQQEGDAQNRAAVLIQSQMLQVGAERAVAEKTEGRMPTGNSMNVTRRGSSSNRRRSWAATTDREKAAVLIQAQVRQAQAKSETARRREQQVQQQQQRRSSMQGGEVGAVVVTRVHTKQERVARGAIGEEAGPRVAQ